MALTMDNTKNKMEIGIMSHRVKIEEIICHFVTVDSTGYTRYGADSWYQRMGESDEPIYSESKVAELEDIFQSHQLT